MSMKRFVAVVLCLLVISFIIIAAVGSRFTFSADLSQWYFSRDAEVFHAEDYDVTAYDPEIVEVSNVRVEGKQLKMDLRALKRGETFIDIRKLAEDALLTHKIYVHAFGIITQDTYFGRCTGGFMIPLSALIILILLYIDRIRKFWIETKESIYRYRNIMNLGLIVYMTFLIIKLIMVIFRFRGIDASVDSVLASAGIFTYVALPVAFIVSVLVSLNSLSLMRKEGISWRNMLGFILGLVICLMTVLPDWIYRWIQAHPVVDIFNEKGVTTHAYSMLENSIFFIVAYLECILLGTVVFGIIAARHIPAFDKDYILILGSQIRADGTLTPLLKARADRAVEFAEMQKEATGRDIVFVPSGGKGDDEIMAEADAIGNYLKSKGLPEDRILREDRSLNTYENIQNSVALINGRENGGNGEGSGAAGGTAGPKAAFSTTNYHVFRAGLIADELGYRMEGIGSPTKRYFWVNAFIREFIATLVSEKKRHLKVIIALLVGVFAMVALNYISIVL